MRIVLLVTDLQRGGTPLRIARTARSLRELGVEPVVGCLATRGPVSDDLERDGIRVFACDARGPRDLSALSRLLRTVRQIKPDLIHSSLVHANLAARWVRQRTGIATLTSTATIEVERRWHRVAERLTARCDDGHIVSSRAVADHVIAAFGRRRDTVFIVPPSVEPIAFLDQSAARASLNIADDARVLAWAGRFDPVKRIDLLVDVAERLDDRCVLLLAGDGPLLTSVREDVKRRGLERRVRLLGWQSDLGPLLSAADLLLFPSRTEGVPNVLLQALIAGVPVLASDIAPHRELAEGGGIELVAEPAIKESWARQVAELLSNADRRGALSGAAAANGARFTERLNSARALLNIYQKTQQRRESRR